MNASTPNAEITFDRFHIMKIMKQTVDDARRQEATTADVIKSKILTRGNTLSVAYKSHEFYCQAALLEDIRAGCDLKTARAYQIRLTP